MASKRHDKSYEENRKHPRKVGNYISKYHRRIRRLKHKHRKNEKHSSTSKPKRKRQLGEDI